jgi:hypothetical protein
MRTIILLATLLAACFIGSPANASTAQAVHVTTIIPNNAGIVMVYIDTARSGLPTCAGTNTVQFSFSVTTPAGQAMLSGLYLALASNWAIDIAGTGVCDAAAGVESVGFVSVHR